MEAIKSCTTHKWHLIYRTSRLCVSRCEKETAVLMFGTTAMHADVFSKQTSTVSVVFLLFCFCILEKMQIHKDKDREKPSYHESSKSPPPLSKTLAGSRAPWIALNNHQEIRRRHLEFSLEQPANVQLDNPSLPLPLLPLQGPSCATLFLCWR